MLLVRNSIGLLHELHHQSACAANFEAPQNKYDFVCDERPLCLDTFTEKKSKAQAKKTSPLFKEANHSNFLSEYWMFMALSSASSFSKLEPRQVSRQNFYLKRVLDKSN